ncbi:MAG: ribonuclease D [Pseudomonas sp.]|nr:MAG: ribonuclease D [Pseudomonas sp.]
MPIWIDEPAALQARLQQPPAWVGLDTEFVRERTYWPQLALVQMSIDDEILLIDPLAPGITAALRPLLEDRKVLKVMHSASEDLVALSHDCGALPAPLFDTQVAAALCGVGGGMGYQKLVQEITGVTLAKGETRSDWLRRPLSDSQLEYAADDVVHLGAIYRELDSRLVALGRRDWLDQDAERMLANATEDGDRWPHLAMRSAQFLEADAQLCLLRLLRWRDAQARDSDKPRSWILDNELATQLARTPPADRARLQAMLDAHPKAPRKLGDAIWQALATAMDDEAVAPLAHNASTEDKNAVRRLQDAVAARSTQLGLPDGILASRRYLESLHQTGLWPAGLSGWRRAELEPLLSPLLAPAAS